MDPRAEFGQQGIGHPCLTKTGSQAIADERQRQLTQEGWTSEHDDKHADGELEKAAACYALGMKLPLSSGGFQLWPWEEFWWKPSDDKLVNLAKAGALIAAAYDREVRARKAAENA